MKIHYRLVTIQDIVGFIDIGYISGPSNTRFGLPEDKSVSDH